MKGSYLQSTTDYNAADSSEGSQISLPFAGFCRRRGGISPPSLQIGSKVKLIGVCNVLEYLMVVIINVIKKF